MGHKGKVPYLGQHVTFYHPISERQVRGQCTEHLNSQWMFTCEEGWVQVIHMNWKWTPWEGPDE